ncbi:hypothetical protein [Kitasatospora purpeofusca]|uniref:hypothetical protein n=1 Tax=Kitasatospora purpeofusca TaxID=67352 RepID=UPI00365D05E5
MKRDRGRERAPFGIPKDIVVLATRGGWRHSIVTSDGEFVCGHLPDVSAGAGAEQAKERAGDLVRELGREIHGVALDVAWEEAGSPDSWTGHVRPVPEPHP